MESDGLLSSGFRFMAEQPLSPIEAYEPEWLAQYYGESKKTPVLKDHCSYCGLVIENPYLQHDDCIKLQIEVKKNPAPKMKDSATVDVCALWIKKQWEGIILPKMYLGGGPIPESNHDNKS